MKLTQVSVIAIIFIVIAVSIAGCTSSSPAAPAKSLTSGPPSDGSGASSDGTDTGSSTASGAVSGASLFGGLNYNWVEYKIVAGSGNEKVTIYEKWTREGKCTIRFEGVEQIAGIPSEIDCSGAGAATSDGSQVQSNPNDINPDVRLVKVGTETVTVGAGTFVADKYTATSGGVTATYWIVAGKPLIKMEGIASGGSPNSMELNGIG